MKRRKKMTMYYLKKVRPQFLKRINVEMLKGFMLPRSVTKLKTYLLKEPNENPESTLKVLVKFIM